MWMARKAVPGSKLSVLSCQFSVLSTSVAPSGADNRSSKYFQILLRQLARLHFQIGYDVRGLAFGQQRSRFRASQFIAETNHFLPHMFQPRPHNDLVIIMYRGLVAALRIDDRDEAIVFALHIFIAEAKLPHQFNPSNFEPDEVIGMVDDAHLVGFGIAHADASFIHRLRALPVDRHRGVEAAHRPVHLGLRFSRNDSIPSRKSALSRMPAFSRMAASICTSSSARA